MLFMTVPLKYIDTKLGIEENRLSLCLISAHHAYVTADILTNWYLVTITNSSKVQYICSRITTQMISYQLVNS